jgi:8-oxo-dGTP diphosphatase
MTARRTGRAVGCPWFDPLVVEVVLGALVVGGRVLLGHRSPDKRARPNAWDLPGGVIEVGESELDALAREMQEELGVLIATDSALHLCRVTTGPPSAPALLSAWLVRNWDGTPANLAPEEHVSIGWFGTEELPPLAHAVVRAAVLNTMQGERG